MTRYRIRQVRFNGASYWTLERDYRGVRGHFRANDRCWFAGSHSAAVVALRLVLTNHPAAKGLQWTESATPITLGTRRVQHRARHLRLVEERA